MRKLLIAFMLAGLAGTARAQSSGPTRQTQPISSVVASTDTCLAGVSISTSAGTDVVQSTSTSGGGYFAVYVENQDASASLYCNEQSGVSTSTGKEIPPTPAHSQHAWFTFYLAPGERLYCLSSGASSTSATVCRWH